LARKAGALSVGRAVDEEGDAGVPGWGVANVDYEFDRAKGRGRYRIEARSMNGFESALSLIAETLRLVTTPAGYGIGVWVLATVFVWSGIAKLRRPALAAMAIVDFGVLRRVRPRLGAALGAAELLLALFLATGTLPVVFLPAAAVLLWIFALLIARSLFAGEDFACFCFGDGDSRLSWATLARTVTLALLASVLTVAVPRTGTYADPSEAYVLQAVSAVALVGVIVLGSQLPKLLRWNRHPYRIGNTEVNE
jgi:hypothetical protein